MSAFLGPIHFQMYEKIKTVSSRSVAVFSTFFEKFGTEVEEVCGCSKSEAESWVDNTPLDQQIGDAAIHGWLSGKVDEAESREARLVKALLEKYGDSGRALVLEAVYWHGKAVGLKAAEKHSPETLEELVGVVSAYLLDGMPCDSVVKNFLSGGFLSSEHSKCLHVPNWDESGADTVFMCDIVRRWIDGFCESINPDFKHDGKERVVSGDEKCVDVYRLEKKP
ncbi:MAG: hypothetical protein ACE5FU_08395 [Nitrospinota bacterium]